MKDLETWRRAGKVAAQALEYGRGIIRNGANIREVCDLIDAKVIELGARPAWPTQVGRNHVAAHWTSDLGDTAVFDNDLVCLDVGAHINGCVGDNATTIDLSGANSHIAKASHDALRHAVKAVAVGARVGDIGRVIQETIESHGLKPVHNLCGHGISKWVIHDAPSIPNYDNGDPRELKEGEIIAIEPFATDGAGAIHEAGRGNIFAVVCPAPVRNPTARDILAFVRREYGPLPFTTRWLAPRFGAGKTQLALTQLLQAGILHAHPPLVEKAEGQVAVFETTLHVGEKVEELTAAS